MNTINRLLCTTIFLLISFNALANSTEKKSNVVFSSLAPLLKTVSPAVVDITVSGTNTTSNSALDLIYENRSPRVFSGLGSGVVIDAERGHIVTNYHVIEGADKINITLTSGHRYSAEVIGQDPQSDIALLKVESKYPLVEIKFSDSDQLQVGDFTIAIGNPFGLGQTVTTGIVSALGRSGLNLQNLENYIQTDAAINSGNSGGALLNSEGELIGINTAILGPNGGNIGIAFAIPSNMVKNLVHQLLEYGEVHRGILGIKGGEITPDLVNTFALSINHGAFIYEVVQNSAADIAGLQAGDVITAINGVKIKSFSALRATIGTLRAEEKVLLEVVQDNKAQTISAVLGGTIPDTQAPLPLIFEGVTLKDTENNQGIQITHIEKNTLAARAGFKAGDLIISVNRTPVNNYTKLLSMLDDIQTLRAFKILRNNRPIFIVLD